MNNWSFYQISKLRIYEKLLNKKNIKMTLKI